MEDTNHIDFSIICPIKDQMPTDSVLAVAFANCIPGTPEAGIIRDLAKTLVDQMQVAFRLLFQVSTV